MTLVDVTETRDRWLIFSQQKITLELKVLSIQVDLNYRNGAFKIRLSHLILHLETLFYLFPEVHLPSSTYDERD